MTEIWKDITGYSGIYQVSNTGKVKSLHARWGKEGKILKPPKNTSGYEQVYLCSNGGVKAKYVHHLVCEVFIGPRLDRMEIDHIDRNKTNNCVNNLRYVTRSMNHGNRSKTGESTSRYKGVYYSTEKEKYQATIKRDGKRKSIGYYRSEKEAALAYDEKAEEYGYTTNAQLGLIKE